jgi:hypothetical protein
MTGAGTARTEDWLMPNVGYSCIILYDRLLDSHQLPRDCYSALSSEIRLLSFVFEPEQIFFACWRNVHYVTIGCHQTRWGNPRARQLSDRHDQRYLVSRMIREIPQRPHDVLWRTG